MDRRLFLPVVIMFLSVLLLGGLISYQAGSAQESPEENPAPVIGEKETVVQDSPKASAQEPEEKTNTSIKEAPASTPTFMGMGGGGTPKTSSTETGNPVTKVEGVVVADFDYTVDGLNVTFNDTSQNASFWYWDFGDNTNSKAQDPVHEYAVVANYTVTLTAYGEDELKNSSIVNYVDLIQASEEEEEEGSEEVIVVADFDYAVDGLNVTFADMSENASSWYWDFGDNTNSTARNPEHEYAVASSHTVTLTAYGEDELNNASVEYDIDLTEKENEDEKNPPVTQEVPEFPTIAIPMVAIIGMAFIFSRRQ
jgi:PKD repeat protein